jgi:hypothetical protein
VVWLGTVLEMMGPPPVASGSIVPVIRYIRLGHVGPSSEQW